MSEKWRNENWFTSSWNFAEEVRNSLHFSDHIKIHDVTLRDGEQQAGLIFDYKQKIALAEKLSEMGIHRIEAGMPAVSAQDRQVIVDLAKRSDIKSEIFAFARCMVDDVKRAADCGVKGVVIEIPCNEEMITKAYGWTMERALELSIQASLAAKEAGLYTVFFPIDMTRASMKWSLDLLEHVADNGHMDALAIVDTMGVLAPHTVPYLVKAVKARIPGKPVELHFHDDYGLGAANTIMGLAAGADVAHTTIGAVGERAGNAPYEDVVLSLLTLYGVDLGLDYSQIYPLSKIAARILRPAIPRQSGHHRRHGIRYRVRHCGGLVHEVPRLRSPHHQLLSARAHGPSRRKNRLGQALRHLLRGLLSGRQKAGPHQGAEAASGGRREGARL